MFSGVIGANSGKGSMSCASTNAYELAHNKMRTIITRRLIEATPWAKRTAAALIQDVHSVTGESVAVVIGEVF
jgi:hypothetical protein